MTAGGREKAQVAVRMDDGPHRRMYTLDAESPAPHPSSAAGHTGSNDRLHRGDADPKRHGDTGPNQYCRDDTATSEHPDTGGRDTATTSNSEGNYHGRTHDAASKYTGPRTCIYSCAGRKTGPIVLQDSHSLQSALSEAELGCIGDNPEELAFALRGPGPEPPEEQARLLNCLHDETIARLFVAGFVPGPDPLSPETSQCVREAFGVIDPRSVMMAGIEGDPGRAMAGSMVASMAATACLTDKEWDLAAPMSGLTIQGRQEGRCLMEALETRTETPGWVEEFGK